MGGGGLGMGGEERIRPGSDLKDLEIAEGAQAADVRVCVGGGGRGVITTAKRVSVSLCEYGM